MIKYLDEFDLIDQLYFIMALIISYRIIDKNDYMPTKIQFRRCFCVILPEVLYANETSVFRSD